MRQPFGQNRKNMNVIKLWRLFISALSFGLWMLGSFNARSAELSLATNEATADVFAARGVVQEVRPGEQTLVIRHEAITNYMAAMTMPFHVQDPVQMAGLARGDEVTFKLFVTDTDSWVDDIVKVGKVVLPEPKTPASPQLKTNEILRAHHPLLDYKFTNELGNAVSLNDFHGTVLAITFFYTRCPIPEYCPRLSKNFQAVARQLASRPDAPKNWHLLSVSLDPQFDSPAMLKAYGQSYNYDPAQWSFLTGPADKIGELARQSGVTFEATGDIINHNFSTLIVDASGRLQTMIPVGGDLSDTIVSELIKAADTNQIQVRREEKL